MPPGKILINIRFPAPGYRDAGDHGQLGLPVSNGDGGYCWSATISGTRGIYLCFYTTSLYSSYAGFRAYGLQLRCLSE